MTTPFHGDGLTIERRLVQVPNCVTRLSLRLHVNEAATVHNVAFRNNSIVLEQPAQLLGKDSVAQASHEYFGSLEGIKEIK